MFDINYLIGEVIFKKLFDFERIKKYIFNIIVDDCGNFFLFVMLWFIVNVIDENDYFVFVDYLIILRVLENVIVGFEVGRCFVIDKDIGENGKIIFSIDS